MKSILIVFFIVSLVLMLFVFPFKARLMGHFNLFEKKGFYSFKAWRIKLLCGKVYLDGNNQLKVENTNNALKGSYQDEFMKRLGLEILKEMDVKKVELFFSGGFKDNSFSSAIICGGARFIVDIIYSFLSQKYEKVRLIEDISPEFYNDTIELTFDFVVAISIFQILKSLIIAKLNIHKERKI